MGVKGAYFKNPVFALFVVLFTACFVQALAAMAGEDAKYLIICRWESIDSDQCLTSPIASKLMTVLLTYIGALFGLISIFTGLVIPHLVNIYGIRPVVIGVSIIGVIQAAAYTVLLSAGPNVHYLWAVVPEVLVAFSFGIWGQFLGGVFVSEKITDARTRTIYLGWMIGIPIGAGVLGSAMGAVLLKLIGVAGLYRLSLLCSLGSAVFTVMQLPESHTVAEERPSIFEPFKLMRFRFVEDPVRRTTTKKLVWFTVGTSVLSATLLNAQAYYLQSQFSWGAKENGYLGSTGSVACVVSVTLLSPLAIEYLSARFQRFDDDYDTVDAKLSIFFVGINLAATMLIALLPYPATFFAAQCVSQLGAISSSTILNNVFKYAPLGLLASFWTGVNYLTQLVVVPISAIIGGIYFQSVETAPQLVFWVISAGWAGLFAYLWTIRTRSY